MSKVRKRFESPYKIPPKEMIMTRHKSALLKKRLRKKDGSVTNINSLPNITALKTKTKKKRGRKKEEKLNKSTEKQEVEFYPNLKKRFYVQKPFLKPQMKLKIICGTKSDNKRKLHIPLKTSNSTHDSSSKITESNEHHSENIDMSEIDTCPSPEYSELSMNEILRFTEDTQDLTDEDFIEILTCPSPVWWEDPPEEENYIEESIFTRPPSKGKPIKSKTTLKESARALHATDECMSKTDKFKMKRANLENIISCVKNKNDVTESDDETTNDISSYKYKTIAENKQSCLLEAIEHKIRNNNQTFPSRKNTTITERFSINSDNDDLLSLDINLNNDELLEQLENTEIPIENLSAVGNKVNNNDNKNKISKYCLPHATTDKRIGVNDVDIEALLLKNIVHRKVIHIMDPEQQSNNVEPPSKIRRYKNNINGLKRITGYITLKNVESNEIVKVIKTTRPSEQELMGHKRKRKKDNDLKKTNRACNIQDILNFNKVANKEREDVNLIQLKNELLKYMQEDIKQNSEDHKLVSYQVRDNIQNTDRKVENVTKYKTLSEINGSVQPDQMSAPKINTTGHKTYKNTKINSIILDTVNKTNTNLIQSKNPTLNKLSLSIANAVVASSEVASIEKKIPESNIPIINDTILSPNTDVIQGNQVISNLETNVIKANRRKNKITKTLQAEKELGESITPTKMKRKVNPPLKFSSREFCLGNGIRGVQKLLKHDHKNHSRKPKFKSDNKDAVESSKINDIESVKTAASNKIFNTSFQSNSESTPILENPGNLTTSVKNCDDNINAKISSEKVTEKTSETYEADEKPFNINKIPNVKSNASKNALQSELSNTVAQLFGPLPSNDIKLSKIKDSKLKIYKTTHASLANSESILIEQNAKITKKSPKKGNCSTKSSRKGLIKNTSNASKKLNEPLDQEHMESSNGKLYAKYYPTKRRVSLLKTNRNLNQLDNHDNITNDTNNKKESTVEKEKYYPAKRSVSLLRTNINLKQIDNHDNITNDLNNKKESTAEKEKSTVVSNNDPDLSITDEEIDNDSEKDETKVDLNKKDLKIDNIDKFIQNLEPINSMITNEISDANESIANAQKEIKSYYKNCKKTYVSKNDEIKTVESKKPNIEVENCPDCQPKPRKPIMVTDQNIKYCMKCSSIFDSDECSYCLTLKQQFVCNFCKISCCCIKKLEIHEKNHDKSNENEKDHEKSNENQKIDTGIFKSLFCGECNYKFKDKLDITGHICPETDEIKNNTSD